jgi:GGDEF domain-containing protein
MAEQTPFRVALAGLNLVVLATWVWLATATLATPVAVGAGVVLLVVQGLLWYRLTMHQDAGSQPGRSAERITALISRTESRRQSIREESTGLYYRWYLEMRLQQEAARCDRYKHSMAVVVLRAGVVDLNQFSSDLWQTQSAITAERCAKVVRNVDLSAFLAPMEYGLCLIQCDRTGAEQALLRLRGELSEYAVDAGVAVYPDDGCEPLALIELARVRSRREVARNEQARPSALPTAVSQ